MLATPLTATTRIIASKKVMPKPAKMPGLKNEYFSNTGRFDGMGRAVGVDEEVEFFEMAVFDAER